MAVEFVFVDCFFYGFYMPKDEFNKYEPRPLPPKEPGETAPRTSVDEDSSIRYGLAPHEPIETGLMVSWVQGWIFGSQ
tara:strand:+ start:53 stop:286 length:234 start_codon:yes stop_codon:yes gene_type:complete